MTAAARKGPELDVRPPEDDGERRHFEAEADRLFGDVRSLLVISPSLTFWAYAGLHLPGKADWTIPTCATDSRRIFYNPIFWTSLSDSERLGVFAHEIMHAILGHCSPQRMGGRVGWKWQAAIDLCVNSLLRHHFSLPQDVLFPATFKGGPYPEDLSVEEYYNLIPDSDACRLMAGEGSQLSTGPALPAPDGQDTAPEWRIIASQAMGAARMRGNAPAGLDRLIGLQTSQIDWRAALREFLAPKADDYAWTRPNRRHIWSGVYLPGKGETTEMGTIVVLVDASSSMTDDDLALAAAEIEAATSLNPKRVLVYSHETEAELVQDWTPECGPFRLTKVKGGGGTSHVHAFELVGELDDAPEAVIAFTDLMSEFPGDPGIPVLWVHRGAKPACAPAWGRFVSVPL